MTYVRYPSGRGLIAEHPAESIRIRQNKERIVIDFCFSKPLARQDGRWLS